MKKIRKFLIITLTMIVGVTMTNLKTENVKAEDVIKMNLDGFEITFYDDGGGLGSLWITGYNGKASEITLPTEIHYNGKTYTGDGIVGENAFAGNTTIQKVIIPKGYEVISEKAFYGCTNLNEVIIGENVNNQDYYLGGNVFTNCPKLKTLRIGIGNTAGDPVGSEFGFGVDTSGKVYAGVTAYVVKGSSIDANLKDINSRSTGNKITIVYEETPAKAANVTYVVPAGTSSGGKGSGENKNGKSSKTFYKGASFQATEKAVTAWNSENDPEGSVYSGLQAKATKVTKNSVKVSWKKVSGAKKYVIYGNKCGKKNKYVKLKELTKTSVKFKKIGKKKITKGTYYKFIVLAIDKNNCIVSTSKTIHIATKGGKVGNDKKVSLKPNKKSVSIAVKKTYKLKAKEVPTSKKLKVKRHRKLKYETSNESVATVSAKGVITGKAKGNCEVYIYAQNGVSAKVKVTVK
ncbi:MAG: leucine-rich repeat protein [Eubacterium sp.]|nr:leucine-rich repeat protein [Eubacterium sp.]